MLAMLEMVPYLAFVGAGLLIAFVAGEALYKKFLSLRLGAFSAKPITASKPAVAAQPEPQITVQNERSERVLVRDEQLNVRISDPAEDAPAQQESAAQPAVSQDSAQFSGNSDQMQPVEDMIVTTEIQVVSESERQQPMPISAENGTSIGDTNESLEEGDLCNEVVAIRRDPSVRVFDAVVAPSERKNSAA